MDAPGLPDPRLIDRFQRHLNYLRISITDRCNLSCIYCMPRELVPKLHHADILSYEEIMRIVEVGRRLGITKLRVTGGEPLVRKGVYAFLADLTRLDGIRDVSLTTNGMLLAANVDRIAGAGIRRVNVSLDSLRPDRFARITGHDGFDDVWRGLMGALEAGLSPVKINVVALAGVNEDELVDMAALTRRYPFHVRFIEHMPIGQAAYRSAHPLRIPDIRRRLAPLGPLEAVDRKAQDGPAECFRLSGAPGTVGFIGALSSHFCARCNRLRLTASGQLRPCLLSSYEIDLRKPLREGAERARSPRCWHRALTRNRLDITWTSATR